MGLALLHGFPNARLMPAPAFSPQGDQHLPAVVVRLQISLTAILLLLLLLVSVMIMDRTKIEGCMATWRGIGVPLGGSGSYNPLGNAELLVTKASQWEKLHIRVCMPLDVDIGDLQTQVTGDSSVPSVLCIFLLLFLAAVPFFNSPFHFQSSGPQPVAHGHWDSVTSARV